MESSQYHGVSFEFLWLNLISQYNFQIEWIPFITTADCRPIQYYNISILHNLQPSCCCQTQIGAGVWKYNNCSQNHWHIIFIKITHIYMTKLRGFFYLKTSLLIFDKYYLEMKFLFNKRYYFFRKVANCGRHCRQWWQWQYCKNRRLAEIDAS